MKKATGDNFYFDFINVNELMNGFKTDFKREGYIIQNYVGKHGITKNGTCKIF